MEKQLLSMRTQLLAGVLLILSFHQATAQNFNLRINELVANNQCDVQDDFLNNDDWLEIYNPSGNPISNLAGYYLSDDPDTLNKWLVTDLDAGVTTVLPNNHIIFWCDKEVDEGVNHTSFSMSGDGETIFLVAPDGTSIIDSVSYPIMADDVSYGRTSDGAATWQYFSSTTYEDPNAETVMPAEVLFINEVQTVNTSTVSDGNDEYEQWIEIYNPNACPVNLAGYFVSNTANELLFEIPNTNPYRTVVPSLGFLLLWCDGETSDDTNHLSFTLDVASGELTLTAPDGTTNVDSYSYTTIVADQSWGRASDGAPASITFPIPTPRVSNNLIIITSPTLYINEVMTQNQNDTLDNFGELEDWFEIYNPNTFPVNLAGYYFSDNPDVPQKWRVPVDNADSTTVPALGWLLFWADEDVNQGVNHSTFRLNNSLEELGLFTPDGFTLVDKIEWTGMDPDTSLGRLTDGSPEWIFFVGTTPEYSNNEGEVMIDEAYHQKVFYVYPNPTSSIIYWNEKANVRVMDATGRLLLSESVVAYIDLSTLRQGVYMVILDDGSIARVIRN